MIQEQRAIEVGGYRSTVLERTVLEGKLSGDIAAWSYRSRALEKTVVEGEHMGDIAAKGNQSREL